MIGAHSSKYGRRCYRCRPWTDIEPTDEIKGDHRKWTCPKCGAESWWVADPALDGSYAELHRVPDGYGYSAKSMLNDPSCEVFGKSKPRRSRRTLPLLIQKEETPPPPKLTGERKPIFVEDDKGNKTHRWHYGRKQWVKLPRRR